MDDTHQDCQTFVIGQCGHRHLQLAKLYEEDSGNYSHFTVTCHCVRCKKQNPSFDCISADYQTLMLRQYLVCARTRCAVSFFV